MTDSWKKRTVLFSACIFMVILAAVSYSRSLRVHGHLFRSGGGWGYDIVYKGKTLIHQPFMPALPGNVPFPDRRSARAIAGQVASNIRAGESPAVSAEEVRKLMPETLR